MASFDENGKYIKTNWKAGDKITATKLNKIEESIEAVNDNDISRHVEADARLDALEAKDVTHDKELTKIKNTIADNKAAAELGDYDINSRMTFLENELNEGIEEVHNVASTVDGKIATAETNMEAMVAEVEADLEGLHAKDDELSEQVVTNEKRIGNRFNAIKYFNLKGDGTDETENFLYMINSLENGDEVVFPKGIYYVPNWEPISNNEKIQWFGENGTVIKSNKNSSFLNVNNDIFFKNISFEGFKGLLTGKAIPEKVDIKISDCSFNDVGTVISIPSTEIGLNSLKFYNNKVDNNMVGYGLHISCPFENVLIANNTFKNIQTRCVTLGEDNNVYEDYWKKAIITNNFIDNVYATGSNSCYGILCYGKELMVSNNIISNIDSESMDNCEGVYFKGRYSMITNNILIDAGRHEASIAIKGDNRNNVDTTSSPCAYANIIEGNVIYNNRERTTGISISSADCIVINNFIEGVGLRGIWLRGNDFEDITVSNNIIKSFGDRAIFVETFGDRISIKDNKIINGKDASSFGMYIYPNSTTADIKNWVISGNQIDSVDVGIYQRLSTPNMNSVKVCGNSVNQARLGIKFDVIGPKILEVKDNILTNISSQPALVFTFSTQAPEKTILKDNMGFNHQVSGNGVLAANSTSVNITFDEPLSISLTNRESSVSVVLRSSLYGGSYYWISAITQNGFVFNTDVAPTSNVHFSYSVNVTEL